MNITYRTNEVITTKSLTEWYFGTNFVKNRTDAAIKAYNETGETKFKFWQNGTGYLSIEIC